MLDKINLGKNPFRKFTKSALIEMIEDAIHEEAERSLPSHKRGQKEKSDKSPADDEQDSEREKTADLVEESTGKPTPVEMTDEDMSDEAMDSIKKKASKKAK